ncbi:MAG TPA: HD-GYP domain-containing protein [Solirubrobacteraceae bacterium]|nr:HD-GYP domain-containing protein [Solirubrobacteraceae bacterium]
MSFAPTVEEQELFADSFRRADAGMTTRERVAELVMSVGFVAAVSGLWAISPPSHFQALPAALCIVVLALATMIEFDTPFGFTVPTQLAFVPLVFAVPAAIVPVAVLAALLLGQTPDLFGGRFQARRLLTTPGNAWFAIGPALVFALAGVEPHNAGALLLLTALLVQFVVDFSASAVRFEIARGASLASQLRDMWVYAIDAALSGVGLVVAQDITTSPWAVLALVPLLGVLAGFAHERHKRLQSLLELNNAYHGTALVLGDVVEADDGYTGEHCKSVVALALEVGERLELTALQRRNLEFGALLHDIGKIAIPKEIINKPGPLDAEEWAIIKTHTIVGQRMLDRVGGFMRDVGLIVRSHHERWDGGGYPDGLAGDAIPLEARIITCCDSWNAMRTERIYRKALTHEVALAELRDGAGGQFDPRITVALIALVEAEVAADAGEPAPVEPAERAPVEPAEAGEPALKGGSSSGLAAGVAGSILPDGPRLEADHPL